MKYFLISDNVDTLAGMRLVGVHGVVVHEEDEVRAALEKACADEEIPLAHRVRPMRSAARCLKRPC